MPGTPAASYPTPLPCYDVPWTAGGAMTNGESPSNNEVERSRTRAGAVVVVASNLAIATATALAIFKLGKDQVTAILTAAFTAIGTITTAYLGIRAASSTAKSAVAGVGEQVAKAIQQQQP